MQDLAALTSGMIAINALGYFQKLIFLTKARTLFLSDAGFQEIPFHLLNCPQHLFQIAADIYGL